MVTMPIVGAGLALSTMAKVIKEIYGMAENVNDWIDGHIAQMQSSENTTVSRTGRVLEQAKLGFGIGYISSVTVIAVGQLLLGNQLAAATTVVTAAVLANPIAMTCAAVGAIYYGWGALTDQERGELLEKVSNGLEIGVELIRSLINFVIGKIESLFDKKNIETIKVYVATKAEIFGKKLSEVTRTLIDRFLDLIYVVKDLTDDVIEGTLSKGRSALSALDRNGDGKIDHRDLPFLGDDKKQEQSGG